MRTSVSSRDASTGQDSGLAHALACYHGDDIYRSMQALKNSAYLFLCSNAAPFAQN